MTDTELQQKRLIAAGVDVAIGVALVLILGGAGFVVGLIGARMGTVGAIVSGLFGVLIALVILAYTLGRDILAGGRSFGKKVQEIKLQGASGAPVTLMDSVKRNAIFAAGPLIWFLVSLLQLLPFLGGVLTCLLMPLIGLAGLAAVAAAVIEVIKIFQDPEGIRLGDQFAGTRVTK